jgi:hypothetical protein
MKGRTILLPLLLVGALLLLWRAREREEQGMRDLTIEPALFEGLEKNTVRSIRIDHLERGLQLELERDGIGSWFLTDPLAYPADDGLVRSLLEQLSQSQGPIVEGPDLGELRLDPPRVVVEVTETTADGGERCRRVELGALDLDGRRIHVRVPSHSLALPGEAAVVMRVSRTLDTTLLRNLEEYRDPRATPLRAGGVVHLERRGRVATEYHPEGDVTLDAERGPEGWEKRNPPRIRLDPAAVGLVIRGCTDLRILRFVDDSPRSLEVYGLEEPEMSVRIVNARGDRVTLRFGRAPVVGPRLIPPGEEIWYAMREGFDHVWRVRPRDVFLIATPTELLHETRLLRALRKDLRSVALEGAGRRLELQREGEEWFVSERDEGGSSVRYPADPAALEDLLLALEGAELADGPPDGEFAPAIPRRAITITTRDGTRFGGTLGERWSGEGAGPEGRLFRRHGDEAMQLLPEEVAACCLLTLDDLRSLVIHSVDEFLVDRVGIAWGERTQRFRRQEKEWFPELAGAASSGTSSEWTSGPAPIDTQMLIGELCRLQAAEWVRPDPEALEPEAVVVRVTGSFPGGEGVFRLWRSEAGEEFGRLEGGPTARLDPGLIERLQALFR